MNNLISQTRKIIINHQEAVQIFLILATVTWLSHFWYSREFGLYSDDYAYVSPPMGMNFSQMMRITIAWFHDFSQGRPVGFAIITLLSFFGEKLGGLHLIYFFGYLIIVINSFLFYQLLKLLWNQPVFTLTGALAFCLFPANPTQPCLTHSLSLHPTLTFLILAFITYISNQKVYSYLWIFAALLCYETSFFVFLLAPLLVYKWNYSIILKLLKHGFILGVMLLISIILRNLTTGITNDDRFINFQILAILSTGLKNTINGPVTSLNMFIYRPWQTLMQFLKGELIGYVLVSFVGFIWILSKVKIELGNDQESVTYKPSFLRPLGKISILGLLMLLLSYPLTLTTSATEINGLDSRVHLVGILGSSLICACIWTIIFFIAAVYNQKNIARVLLATFLTLLVGFGLTVQQDYILAWQYQRSFWTDLVRLSPDLTKNTVVLVDSKDLKMYTQQMTAYSSYSTTHILPQIYQFPLSWSLVPKAYILPVGWMEHIKPEGGLLQLKNFFELNKIFNSYLVWVDPPERTRLFSSKDTIVLEIQDGELTRRTKPMIIQGQEFPIKQPLPSKTVSFTQGHLYKYLVKSPEEKYFPYTE